MKKVYIAPELNIIMLDLRDVITHSLATGDGDNGFDFNDQSGWDDWGWDENGDAIGIFW